MAPSETPLINCWMKSAIAPPLFSPPYGRLATRPHSPAHPHMPVLQHLDGSSFAASPVLVVFLGDSRPPFCYREPNRRCFALQQFWTPTTLPTFNPAPAGHFPPPRSSLRAARQRASGGWSRGSRPA